MLRFMSVFLILFSALTASFSLDAFEETHVFSLEGSSWKPWRVVNLEPGKSGGKEAWTLCEKSDHNPETLDLSLDFEGKLDRLPNYRVIDANYMVDRFQSVNGKSSAKFYLSDHYISLQPGENSIFAPGKVPGSFTIEFWTYFYRNYDNQYILQYVGNNLSDERDRNRYGLSIITRNGMLTYRFENIFWSPSGEPFSYTITEDEPFAQNQWEHHAVSFNINNGKLTTWKNGVEQQTLWITTDGKVLSPIFNPYIQEQLSTPIIIGRNGIFSLDKFRITRDALTSFDSRRYEDREALIETDVYKLDARLCYLRKIVFDTSSTGYSHIRFAYRISESYFSPDDRKLPWVYVQNGLDSFPEEQSKGRYIQYRVIAIPFPDTDTPIALRKLRLEYTVDEYPVSPFLVSAVPGDGKAVITFLPSPEDDISGYEVYYGSRSQDYICSDSASGVSPVFVPAGASKNSIKPVQYILDGIRNERPYFISVRTIDRNGQRSGYSRELYVRPSSVQNPNRYSIDR